MGVCYIRRERIWPTEVREMRVWSTEAREQRIWQSLLKDMKVWLTEAKMRVWPSLFVSV